MGMLSVRADNNPNHSNFALLITLGYQMAFFRSSALLVTRRSYRNRAPSAHIITRRSRNMTSTAAIYANRFLADHAAPLSGFNVNKSFAQLRFVIPIVQLRPNLLVIFLFYFSEKEKKYVHYVGQASWAGARIIQGGVTRFLQIICIHLRETGQWTSQARDLYDLLILTFTDFRGSMADLTTLQSSSKLSSADWDDLLQYTIQVCLKES